MSSARIRLSAEGNVTISNRVESIPLVRSDRRYAAQYAATATVCAVCLSSLPFTNTRGGAEFIYLSISQFNVLKL